MNSVFLGKREIKVAGSFDELSAAQLTAVASIIHREMPKHEMQLRLLMVLLNIKRHFRLRWQLLTGRISEYGLADMVLLTDFIFQESKLSKNLLPFVRHGLRKFFGPADGCANLSFIEFTKAEHYYVQYLKTKNESNLNTLCAVLYRPAKWGLTLCMERLELFGFEASDDVRRRFNDNSLQERAAHFSKMPSSLRLAILMFYHSCRLAIIQNHPNVFPEPDEFDLMEEPQRVENRTWAHVLRDLAGHLNAIEKTAFQPLSLVLFDLEAAIIDNRRLKRELEESRTQNT